MVQDDLLASAVFDENETGNESWLIKNRAWTQASCRVRADSCGPRTRLPPEWQSITLSIRTRLLQATGLRTSVSAGSVVVPFSKA